MATLKKLMQYKYLTLIPTSENKEKLNNMKNCGVKSEI